MTHLTRHPCSSANESSSGYVRALKLGESFTYHFHKFLF